MRTGTRSPPLWRACDRQARRVAKVRSHCAQRTSSRSDSLAATASGVPTHMVSFSANSPASAKTRLTGPRGNVGSPQFLPFPRCFPRAQHGREFPPAHALHDDEGVDDGCPPFVAARPLQKRSHVHRRASGQPRSISQPVGDSERNGRGLPEDPEHLRNPTSWALGVHLWRCCLLHRTANTDTTLGGFFRKHRCMASRRPASSWPARATRPPASSWPSSLLAAASADVCTHTLPDPEAFCLSGGSPMRKAPHAQRQCTPGHALGVCAPGMHSRIDL